MATTSTTIYQELRAAYDLAFRQLARELQHVNLLQICDDTESSRLWEAQQRLSAAQSCYLERRNALAGHLLLRRSETRPTLNLLETRAYFVGNSGQFSVVDRTSWLRREANHPKAVSTDPCVSC